MAKLTLSFKDRKLKVFALSPGDTLIGRDPACAIVIDSLAIEPHHARVSSADNNFLVEPVSDDTPLLINDQPVNEPTTLSEGDCISIGKHSLSFSEENEGTVLELNTATTSSAGWLQIQSGSHLGRTIRLDKAFTRIGKPDGHLAVIARRDDGYYLSHLQGEQTPSLNGNPIKDETCQLNNADQVDVGSLQVQFFADNDAVQNPETDEDSPEVIDQRRFSRIPFDVAATLNSGDRSWETDLLDISLHGALIKTPQDFDSTPTQPFQLVVHLEGGPDICMDAMVAHHEKQEVGLKCVDIDVDSITHLRRLVELNLGDAELLERELSALG